MLVAEGITKSYGATNALDHVSLELRSGEVHALLGMNGAGKSTLVNILCGVDKADEGELHLDSRRVLFPSRHEALEAGVVLVPQHPTVYTDLDLTSNLFVGSEIVRAGLIRGNKEKSIAAQLLGRVGIDHDPSALAAVLTTGERQLLEIARALLSNPRVLLLDEPTAALPTSDRDRLFEIMAALSADGTAIALITHFIGEALGVAQRITVLRDHHVVIAGEASSALSISEVISAMTGLERDENSEPESVERDRVVFRDQRESLEIQGLGGDGLEDISFTVSSGEIVGLAGLMGSGIEQIFDAVTAQRRPVAGRVVYPGGHSPGSTAAAVRLGLAYVPPDRAATGLMAEKSILENIELVSFGRSDRRAISTLSFSTAATKAADILKRLSVRFSHMDQPVGTLSGGNQQKVLFGKWMHADATVYVLDDPTRAVDVHAKREIHRVLLGLRETGAHILIASTDPEELVDLCDRLLVVNRGRISHEFDRSTGLTIDATLAAMSPLPWNSTNEVMQ